MTTYSVVFKASDAGSNPTDNKVAKMQVNISKFPPFFIHFLSLECKFQFRRKTVQPFYRINDRIFRK